MFGAKLTLIVLTSQRLARIDLAGPRGRLRVERVWSCPAIAHEPAAALAIAYRMGEATTKATVKPARSKRSLIVLSDDMWSGELTLPLDVTVLLQPAELQQALAIEAENSSGISAFSSKIIARQLVDTSSNLLDASTNLANATNWWVAQIAQSELASLTSAARICGAKLLGVAPTQSLHHAGLNRCGTDDSPIENTLDTVEALQEFGHRWAQVLSEKGFELLARPEDTDNGNHRMRWLQAGAAVITAMVCTAVYHVRSESLAAMELQVKQLQAVQAEQDSSSKKLRQAEQQLQQSREKTQAKVSVPAPVLTRPVLTVKKQSLPSDASRPWLTLFDALSSQTPEDCWIESWSAANGRILLKGRATSATVIHELATRLEFTLTPSDWRIEPPNIQPSDYELLMFELPVVQSGDWQ